MTSHTPSEIELIVRLWPLFVSVIFLIAWFIRLESRQLFNIEKIQNLEAKIKSHKEFVWEELTAIKLQNNELLKTLSRLEGHLINSRKGVNNETLI